MKELNHYFIKKMSFVFFPLCLLFWNIKSLENVSDIIHANGIDNLLEIIKAAFNPVLSKDILKLALVSSWKTLTYAVAGVSLAIILALFLGILASGVLSKSKKGKILSILIFRSLLNSMRAIHELVWAWLFVAAIGLSPFAAIFAIAISFGGILGKIFADILTDIAEEPISSMKSSGASRGQLLFYAYLPIAIPNMISYTMYRFECAIRSSSVMSFIGLGGLGYQIDLSLTDLKYNEVWTFIYCLIILVVIIELWSGQIRKRLVE